MASAAALAATGCRSVTPTSCAPPAFAPVTLSGADRGEPAVATDGGGGVVAVWASLAGGPVEASSRTPGGGWTAAARLSGDGARDPTVAMSPTGTAIAAWRLPTRDGTDAIQVATRPPDLDWDTATTVSTPGARGRQPQVGVDGQGAAILAWLRDISADRAVVEVSERGPDGTWSAPREISDPAARARQPRLAVAPNGDATLVWEHRVDGHRAIAAATRPAGGAWSPPTLVSGDVRRPAEPDVAVGPRGDAVAIWIGKDGEHAAAYVVGRSGTGPWSPPETVGGGGDRPRELPRPGRADTGAHVVILPDGRAVAAWTLVAGGANRVETATRTASGAWGSPLALSRAGRTAGGVQVAVIAGGVAAVGWEEIDGGLIRVRTTRVGDGASPGACGDLASGRSETADLRLGGGAAPTAVFVDLNRTRVKAAMLP